MSLYDIGKHVIERNGYDPACLIRASRFDDESGLPRIGDVSLNSQRAYERLQYVPSPWPLEADVCTVKAAAQSGLASISSIS